MKKNKRCAWKKKKRCVWSWPDELYQPWWSMALRCHGRSFSLLKFIASMSNWLEKGTRCYLQSISKERKSVPYLLFLHNKLYQIHLLNLLWIYRNPWWPIHGLVSEVPNFFSKRKFTYKAHCFWDWQRWGLLVYFITRFYDILCSFSAHCVNLYILPITYKVNLNISTFSVIFFVFYFLLFSVPQISKITIYRVDSQNVVHCMNLICLNRHNFTNLKLYNKLLIKALTFTITGVSPNQEIFIFNLKKSFLLDEYNYDALKVLFWAFSIHLYENLLFPVWFIYLFFLEYITFHSYSLH